MMTRKELMRWVNQIAQLRAREAFEEEKRSLIAELRQVAAAKGDVEQHLNEAHRAAISVMLRRRIGDSVTSTRDARVSAKPAEPGPNPPVPRAARERVNAASKKPSQPR